MVRLNAKLLAPAVALAFASALIPSYAHADWHRGGYGGGYGYRGGHGYRGGYGHYRGGGGWAAGAAVGGAILGLGVGALLSRPYAAPPPVVYAPPPAYYAPPPVVYASPPAYYPQPYAYYPPPRSYYGAPAYYGR